jgi:hypothetical protein
MYDHKHLDKDTSTRGFATQFCVGVDYTIFTTLLYLVYQKIRMTIPSYFTLCSIPTESLFQCILEIFFVSILLFTISALIQ